MTITGEVSIYATCDPYASEVDDTDIDDLQVEIDDLQVEIDDLQAEIDDLQINIERQFEPVQEVDPLDDDPFYGDCRPMERRDELPRILPQWVDDLVDLSRSFAISGSLSTNFPMTERKRLVLNTLKAEAFREFDKASLDELWFAAVSWQERKVLEKLRSQVDLQIECGDDLCLFADLIDTVGPNVGIPRDTDLSSEFPGFLQVLTYFRDWERKSFAALERKRSRYNLRRRQRNQSQYQKSPEQWLYKYGGAIRRKKGCFSRSLYNFLYGRDVKNPRVWCEKARRFKNDTGGFVDDNSYWKDVSDLDAKQESPTELQERRKTQKMRHDAFSESFRVECIGFSNVFLFFGEEEDPDAAPPAADQFWGMLGSYLSSNGESNLEPEVPAKPLIEEPLIEGGKADEEQLEDKLVQSEELPVADKSYHEETVDDQDKLADEDKPDQALQFAEVVDKDVAVGIEEDKAAAGKPVHETPDTGKTMEETEEFPKASPFGMGALGANFGWPFGRTEEKAEETADETVEVPPVLIEDPPADDTNPAADASTEDFLAEKLTVYASVADDSVAGEPATDERAEEKPDDTLKEEANDTPEEKPAMEIGKVEVGNYEHPPIHDGRPDTDPEGLAEEGIKDSLEESGAEANQLDNGQRDYGRLGTESGSDEEAAQATKSDLHVEETFSEGAAGSEPVRIPSFQARTSSAEQVPNEVRFEEAPEKEGGVEYFTHGDTVSSYEIQSRQTEVKTAPQPPPQTTSLHTKSRKGRRIQKNYTKVTNVSTIVNESQDSATNALRGRVERTESHDVPPSSDEEENAENTENAEECYKDFDSEVASSLTHNLNLGTSDHQSGAPGAFQQGSSGYESSFHHQQQPMQNTADVTAFQIQSVEYSRENRSEDSALSDATSSKASLTATVIDQQKAQYYSITDPGGQNYTKFPGTVPSKGQRDDGFIGGDGSFKATLRGSTDIRSIDREPDGGNFTDDTMQNEVSVNGTSVVKTTSMGTRVQTNIAYEHPDAILHGRALKVIGFNVKDPWKNVDYRENKNARYKAQKPSEIGDAITSSDDLSRRPVLLPQNLNSYIKPEKPSKQRIRGDILRIRGDIQLSDKQRDAERQRHVTRSDGVSFDLLPPYKSEADNVKIQSIIKRNTEPIGEKDQVKWANLYRKYLKERDGQHHSMSKEDDAVARFQELEAKNWYATKKIRDALQSVTEQKRRTFLEASRAKRILAANLDLEVRQRYSGLLVPEDNSLESCFPDQTHIVSGHTLDAMLNRASWRNRQARRKYGWMQQDLEAVNPCRGINAFNMELLEMSRDLQYTPEARFDEIFTKYRHLLVHIDRFQANPHRTPKDLVKDRMKACMGFPRADDVSENLSGAPKTVLDTMFPAAKPDSTTKPDDQADSGPDISGEKKVSRKRQLKWKENLQNMIGKPKKQGIGKGGIGKQATGRGAGVGAGQEAGVGLETRIGKTVENEQMKRSAQNSVVPADEIGSSKSDVSTEESIEQDKRSADNDRHKGPKSARQFDEDGQVEKGAWFAGFGNFLSAESEAPAQKIRTPKFSAKISAKKKAGIFFYEENYGHHPNEGDDLRNEAQHPNDMASRSEGEETHSSSPHTKEDAQPDDDSLGDSHGKPEYDQSPMSLKVQNQARIVGVKHNHLARNRDSANMSLALRRQAFMDDRRRKVDRRRHAFIDGRRSGNTMGIRDYKDAEFASRMDFSDDRMFFYSAGGYKDEGIKVEDFGLNVNDSEDPLGILDMRDLSVLYTKMLKDDRVEREWREHYLKVACVRGYLSNMTQEQRTYFWDLLKHGSIDLMLDSLRVKFGKPILARPRLNVNLLITTRPYSEVVAERNRAKKEEDDKLYKKLIRGTTREKQMAKLELYASERHKQTRYAILRSSQEQSAEEAAQKKLLQLIKKQLEQIANSEKEMANLARVLHQKGAMVQPKDSGSLRAAQAAVNPAQATAGKKSMLFYGQDASSTSESAVEHVSTQYEDRVELIL